MGADQSFFEMPMSTSVYGTSDTSYLKLVEINGSYFVREFTSGASGKVFTFGVLKQTIVKKWLRVAAITAWQ